MRNESEAVIISGVEIWLAQPLRRMPRWIGSPEPMLKILAAWSTLEGDELPMNPRLVGRPGVGKTTLACAAGAKLGRPVYVFQATADTRPEDLIITPVLGPDGKIQYRASALVTAMIRGGVCVLDEGNRMGEKSWASLAPLLDYRRYVESLAAGITVHAHPDFRFVTTMNEDASTFGIPDYIESRLVPIIQLDFPEEHEERAILSEYAPSADRELLEMVVRFLRTSHSRDLDLSVRDGLNVLRCAMRLLESEEATTVGEAFAQALNLVLPHRRIPLTPEPEDSHST